ncbi:substrate-binding periplasmic protein [Aeromonas veronii]|uniref:substrate-binding periplasmic protein n=1 Tax=Aeromonas veronii TaxID=654 RepID=UPI00187E4F7E|nr:transporter substrate-binding domain-containing protein [Aeromonas veronii]MBE8735836.1 amino acid ABC transporter substrate-binding protein [Aeromonas veronii]MBE8738728.1 amino acid ABC transporter substrate-binding protein [Aeromonas veronii]MBE8744679.1 amino acid ABC transporter substrate-binding protein [Aeromonas veronii]MBE8763354.1 amino acid ABC transporter substrate-binding protein [Aeromonas veronii]MBE8840039.1 amino acid ABC transporter substrate-binding protein [Aeromonas ver
MRVIPLFWLLFPLGLPAKELVVCGTMEHPLKFLDANQQHRGLDIDIVTAIFGKLGIPVRIELIDSGARLTRNAETGACDLVMTHSYKAERESYLIYPQQAHLRHSWHFFVRKADLLKIRYETLADLKPWRIGVTRDFSYTPELTAAMADPTYHFQQIPMNRLQLRKLLAGRIDAVPMPLVTAFTQIKEEGLTGKVDYLPKPLKSSPYFNTWARARADAQTPALMAAYDAELLRMKRSGSLKALYDKYAIPYIEP